MTKWVTRRLPDAIHVHPMAGRPHSEDCWCDPDIEYGHEYRVPLFVHRLVN